MIHRHIAPIWLLSFHMYMSVL